ncbi:CoA transferase [Brucella intermedia GD04153]|uniref:CoA transferase n=1 Tax=Brucella intermedia GD04153 TaxID=2975438 RepID=A0AA42KUA4_9HYPH|nr:CaiB/BaiF CoA-transferase family protein [Brucella intermedia]MDH0126760.1 CoA transferase [Brucella intermedia GD04153]
MTPTANDAGPLSGLRVLDLSRVLAGPWATQILGDLGADVVKIEKPDQGDDTRTWGPPWQETKEGSLSGYFLACNRNKRSLAVDIATQEGADIVRQLAGECDIVVENFKVGALARYGLDYESLREINSRLIYCSITGFGQYGPYAERGGYDFLVQGMGGLMSITGPESGEPTKVGVPVVDLFTGLYAVVAIQAALRHRDRTGEGQSIDCALLDSSVAVLANQAMNWLVGSHIPRPMGNGHPNVVPYRTFAAADGHLIVAIGNDGQFRAFCRLIEREDLATNPDYLNNAERVKHRTVLEKILEEEIARYKSADLLVKMNEAGVPGGPINRIDQVFADPHVKAREMVETHILAQGQTVELTRFPARLSASPAAIRSVPQHLGASSAEILTDMGFDAHSIENLNQKGVVGLPRAAVVREEV